MNNFGTQNQPQKNPGSFSISDNKLRIQNSSGQSSVLFEDISSITWKRHSIPNTMFVFIGILIAIMGPSFVATNSKNGDSGFMIFLTLLIGAGIAIYGFYVKTIWEDVIVETRGGMLLSYSVEENEGAIEVNRIENARRGNSNI
jgi:hypothetical protein